MSLTVLVADPELSLSVHCLSTRAGAHSSTDTEITVKGSSHFIQHEDPEVIAKTAVNEVERPRSRYRNVDAEGSIFRFCVSSSRRRVHAQCGCGT